MRTRRRPPMGGKEARRATGARDCSEQQREARGGGEAAVVAADGFQTPRRNHGFRLSRQRRGEARNGSATRANIMGDATPDSAGHAFRLCVCNASQDDISWNIHSPSQRHAAKKVGTSSMDFDIFSIVNKLKCKEETLPNYAGCIETLWFEDRTASSFAAFSPEPVKQDYTIQRWKRRRVYCRETFSEEIGTIVKKLDRTRTNLAHPRPSRATTPRRVATSPRAQQPVQGSVNSAKRPLYTDAFRKRSSPTRHSKNTCDEVITPTQLLGSATPKPLAVLPLRHEPAPSAEPTFENEFPNRSILSQRLTFTFCPQVQSTPIVELTCQDEKDLHALFDGATQHSSHVLSGKVVVDTGFQDNLSKSSDAQNLVEKMPCQNVPGLCCTTKAVEPKHQVLQQLAGVLPAEADARLLCRKPSSAIDCAQLNRREVGSARSMNFHTKDMLAFAGGARCDGTMVASMNITTENMCDDWENDDWMQDISLITLDSQTLDVKNSECADVTAKGTLVVDQIGDHQRAREGSAKLTSDTAFCRTSTAVKQRAMVPGGSGHFPNRYNNIALLEKNNSHARVQIQTDSSSNCNNLKINPAHNSKLNLNVPLNRNATSNVNSDLNQISHPNPFKPSALKAAIMSSVPMSANSVWDKQAGSNCMNDKPRALPAATVATTTAFPLTSCPEVGADPAAPARCGVASKVGEEGFNLSSGACPTKQHNFRFFRTKNNSHLQANLSVGSVQDDHLLQLAHGSTGPGNSMGEYGSRLTVERAGNLNTLLPSHIQSKNMQLQTPTVAGIESMNVLVPSTGVLPAGAQTSLLKPRVSAPLASCKHLPPEVAVASVCPGPSRSGDCQVRSGGTPSFPAAVQRSPVNCSRSAFDILSTNSKPVFRRYNTDTRVTFTGGPKQCTAEEIEHKRQEALNRRRQSSSQQYATQLAATSARQLDGSRTNTTSR